MPAPLPPNDYQNQQWREAYDKCLHYEHNAAGVNDALVRARVLGYSMREAPNDDGRSSVAGEINSCNDDNAFKDLATMYINYFVCYFRAAKACRTSTPSTPSSNIDDTQETLKYLLEKAPQNHATAKRKALMRDGYRCRLTGAYDGNSIETMPHIRPPGAFIGTLTEAAHIVPEPTNAGISGTDENGRKPDYAASIWTVMGRFGHMGDFDELNGAAFHRLENVMTLSRNEHGLFDDLALWLQSTDTPHTYRLHSRDPMYTRGLPSTVTFTTPDPENLPLPSPVYLQLHAVAARVAHLSGAGVYVQKLLGDMEEMTVLSGDGTSAHLLAVALGGISVH